MLRERYIQPCRVFIPNILMTDHLAAISFLSMWYMLTLERLCSYVSASFFTSLIDLKYTQQSQIHSSITLTSSPELEDDHDSTPTR